MGLFDKFKTEPNKKQGTNKESADTWCNKGVTLGELGKHEDAVKCYDRALEIDPDFADAWYNKGELLCELAEFDDGIKCYDKVLEIDPNYASAWYIKGLICSLKEETETVLECLAKAIKLDDEYKEKAKGEECLKYLREEKKFKDLTS